MVGVSRLRVLSILVGGAGGALGRAGVEKALPPAPGAWPWATLIVNLAGTALLAWLTTRLTEVVAPGRYWRTLIGTGFCGALTTFSTFQVEAIKLGKSGHIGTAVGYVATSLAAGLVIAAAATVIARRRRYG
jgi:CrcB protein